MADTELEQLLTAIKRYWSRAPSKKAQPYVKSFFAAVRSGTKITAKVVGNHGTYTVSIQLVPQGLTSACSCYIGKHGHCHHCEALAITFVHDPSLFKVFKPKQRKAVRSLTDVQAYLQNVTLEALLTQLKERASPRKPLRNRLG
jgi:uncharacterized Zn finger protein